ncbi:tRNA-guanine transglycosylase DpdA [Sphingobium sp. H39-3-25]|uniref:tRNA-guanine transglycosylase DpdA n=1 Tax=Sphingobium arseniciresistens TaxID=3030834 RepID=UPI0023B916DA|nr:tRNA-guanine transglycosylase DpdA [Sphingobium arseniciresistens]
MKFIFADSLDYVDPAFDFIGDRSPAERQPYWDDAYPHEILGYAPYDGVLVSRGIVGDHRVKGKYTASQARRFGLVGVRKFLRLDKPEFAHLDIFGDCGAFTYVQEERPPYSPLEMAEFYDECGFTHGCSVDHIIFDFDPTLTGMAGGSDDARARFEITLENADGFRREAVGMGALFKPLGVIQGWSPGSMAEAARRLVTMGYDYLAVGGMVPLKSPEIKHCLEAIRDAVPASTRLHILGFAKADDIDSFHSFDIASFDTTSPLIRAFKDAKQNYYLPGNDLTLRYYTSIRVPQAIENPKLQRSVKKGTFRAEDLLRMEALALNTLRAFDRGEADLEEALRHVLVYSAPLIEERPYEDCSGSVSLARLEERYRTTLKDRPWQECSCAICREAAIDVIIFRGSNRNKRRGIHNLAIYHDHIERLDLKRAVKRPDDFQRSLCAAER